MKVYVYELPKSCAKCDFCDKDNGLCEMLGQYFRDGYDYTDCPLQSLTDHDKQVRKQVCDEIRIKAEDKYFETNDDGEVPIAWVVSEKILDQIEKGEQYDNTRKTERVD